MHASFLNIFIPVVFTHKKKNSNQTFAVFFYIYIFSKNKMSRMSALKFQLQVKKGAIIVLDISVRRNVFITCF